MSGIVRRIGLLCSLALLFAGCSIESNLEKLGPAFDAGPEAPLPAGVCSALDELPPGVPLAGLAFGDQRQDTVESALAGRPFDRVGLEESYERFLAAIDVYATAFEAADKAIGGDRPQPVNVAAFDWRGLHDALTRQRTKTLAILDLLVERKGQPGDPTASADYVELARQWNDAQRAVSLLVPQVRWSHHRAVEYLDSTCGDLPDYEFGE